MTEVLKLYGPPGTGKTTRLLDIMEAELERGVRPDRIAYLSFTTAARREAVERAGAKFGLTQEGLPFFRTLHSIAYRESAADRESLVKGTWELDDFADLVGVEFSQKRFQVDELGPDMGPGVTEGDQLLSFDTWRRNRCLSVPDAYRHWEHDSPLYVVQRFCDSYRAWKDKKDRQDFTDLLETVRGPLPVEVVIVDEAQDLSTLQWRVLDRYASQAKRIYIAGDDDQAIYVWAGADPAEFNRIQGQVEVLGQSYRLPRRIHSLAQGIVERIMERQTKTWAPREEEGSVQWHLDTDRVDLAKDGTYLILFRSHYLGRPVEDRLRSEGIPYATRGRDRPGAEWGEAIITWERLRQGQTMDRFQVQTVLDAMVSGRQVKRGAKAALKKMDEHTPLTLASLKDDLGVLVDGPWFTALGKIGPEEVQYLRAVIRGHGPKALMEEPRIRLSTIHGAKGAEADHVVLLTDVSRKTMETIHNNPDAERRVFYVGATRAKQTLDIVGTENPIFSGLA